jgi:hypothetical protein
MKQIQRTIKYTKEERKRNERERETVKRSMVCIFSHEEILREQD